MKLSPLFYIYTLAAILLITLIRPANAQKAIDTDLTAFFLSRQVQVVITEVEDGNTVWFKVPPSQVEQRANLIAVDTPAMDECFGKEAAEFLRTNVLGKAATMHRDSGDTRDRRGRLLFYITVGGKDINAEMIRQGYAWVPRNYYADQKEGYILMEKEAKRAGRGLCGACQNNLPFEAQMNQKFEERFGHRGDRERHRVEIMPENARKAYRAIRKGNASKGIITTPLNIILKSGEKFTFLGRIRVIDTKDAAVFFYGGDDGGTVYPLKFQLVIEIRWKEGEDVKVWSRREVAAIDGTKIIVDPPLHKRPAFQPLASDSAF